VGIYGCRERNGDRLNRAGGSPSLAGGALYSDNGNTSVFKGVIASLEGPNKALDSLGGRGQERVKKLVLKRN